MKRTKKGETRSRSRSRNRGRRGIEEEEEELQKVEEGEKGVRLCVSWGCRGFCPEAKEVEGMRRRGEDVQGIKSCGEWAGGEGGNKVKVAERERERQPERQRQAPGGGDRQ
jgi:hypothetical protein